MLAITERYRFSIETKKACWQFAYLKYLHTLLNSLDKVENT